MERFEEFLFLLGEHFGFRRLGFVRQNEGAKRDMWSMYRGNLSDADTERMASYGKDWAPREDAPLVEAVNRSAPVDVRLYAQCVAQFEAQLTALGDKERVRMEAFKAAPEVRGWKGEKCASELSRASVCSSF